MISKGVNLPFTGCDFKDQSIPRYCRFSIRKNKMLCPIKKHHSLFRMAPNFSHIEIPFLIKGVMAPSNRSVEDLIFKISVLRDLY